MIPSEKSDLACFTSFDLNRVTDLNRQERETIQLDYQDLYDLASLERGRDQATRSQEGFGAFVSSASDFEDVFGSAQYSQYGDFAISTESRNSSTSISDYVTEDTSAMKECTDVSNKIVIENSIESLRNVIEVTNIPSINRQIIDKSIDTLQTAIYISENHVITRKTM